jgi:hypothetical protein
MGTQSKVQTFPYSFKTAGTGDKVSIGFGTLVNQIGLEIINPRDFYSCQQLYCHFRFLHDGTQAGRNITSVKVTDSTIAPTFTKSMTVNIVPDGSLAIDARVDVSALRNEFGANIVVFGFDSSHFRHD